MLKSKTKKIMAAAAGMLLLCSVAAAETAGLQTVTKAGSNATVQANPKNFTGTAWATSLFSAHSPSKTYAAVASFTPGARTNWHIHSTGQSLIVTEGFGYTQEWGREIVACTRAMLSGVRRASSIGTELLPIHRCRILRYLKSVTKALPGWKR